MKPGIQRKNTSVVRLITRYFVQGLLVLLPLAITIATLGWLSSFLIRQLGPKTLIGGYLTSLGIRLTGNSMPAYFIGWAIVIGVIFLLGLVVEIGARKYIRKTIDSVMQNIPVINKLYDISVRIVSMIDRKDQDDFKGMHVVYCFFGGEKGAAFLALMPTPERFTIKGQEYNVILIPSAPVPVGGSMMLVPADSVKPADMSIEDFTQVYLSMGASSVDILPKSQKQ